MTTISQFTELVAPPPCSCVLILIDNQFMFSFNFEILMYLLDMVNDIWFDRYHFFGSYIASVIPIALQVSLCSVYTHSPSFNPPARLSLARA